MRDIECVQKNVLHFSFSELNTIPSLKKKKKKKTRTIISDKAKKRFLDGLEILNKNYIVLLGKGADLGGFKEQTDDLIWVDKIIYIQLRNYKKVRLYFLDCNQRSSLYSRQAQLFLRPCSPLQRLGPMGLHCRIKPKLCFRSFITWMRTLRYRHWQVSPGNNMQIEEKSLIKISKMSLVN